MGSEQLPGVDQGARLFSNPWPALLGGLVANAAAYLWFKAFGSQALLLVLPGLVATGAAVAIRPRSAVVLGLAAVSGLLARWGLGAGDFAELWAAGVPFHRLLIQLLIGGEVGTWDSAQLLVGVLSGVAAFAALIVLLPRVVQRAIVSVMILFHFVGILSAVASVPPTPALMNWAWTYLYRPYLQFMYLNNAYHFYSPEPGPGTLVWFYVRYEDGGADWYKIPDHSQNPLAQEYQRRLSLAESTNQLQPATAVDHEVVERRRLAAERDGIPPYPGMDASMQRREPTPFSKDMVKTYARFVAHLKARETGKTVSSVKVYRVIHNLPKPQEIAEGVDPAEKHFYYPYYQGEFTPDGELINPQDPYLYWLIPIVKTHDPGAFRAGRLRLPQKEREHNFVIVDLLEEHVRLPTKGPEDSKTDFIPGGEGERPAKKSASMNPATTGVPR
jgi:hypothetical protein